MIGKPDPRPIITVHYRDASGVWRKVQRRRCFDKKGFGPFVRWNKRQIPVGATDREVIIG